MSTTSNRSRRVVPLAASAAALLALSGCHSSASASHAAAAPTGASQSAAAGASAPAGQAATTPAAAGANVHPCSLVTESDATTALGADPGAGQESMPGVTGNGTCVYGAGSTVVRFSVDISGVGKAIYDGDRTTVAGINPSFVHPVNGVGDAAFETPGGATQDTIYLYKGGTFIEITLGVASATAVPTAQLVTLAKTAVGRV